MESAVFAMSITVGLFSLYCMSAVGRALRHYRERVEQSTASLKQGAAALRASNEAVNLLQSALKQADGVNALKSQEIDRLTRELNEAHERLSKREIRKSH